MKHVLKNRRSNATSASIPGISDRYGTVSAVVTRSIGRINRPAPPGSACPAQSRAKKTGGAGPRVWPRSAKSRPPLLAKITGRKPGNLSRTLKTMSRYGLVDLQREKTHVRPVVKATEFRILAAA